MKFPTHKNNKQWKKTVTIPESLKKPFSSEEIDDAIRQVKESVGEEDSKRVEEILNILKDGNTNDVNIIVIALTEILPLEMALALRHTINCMLKMKVFSSLKEMLGKEYPEEKDE